MPKTTDGVERGFRGFLERWVAMGVGVERMLQRESFIGIIVSGRNLELTKINHSGNWSRQSIPEILL
jgi:hypothetical protein